jgi:hypothetical protein
MLIPQRGIAATKRAVIASEAKQSRVTSRLLRPGLRPFARNDRVPEIATEIQDFECE